MTPAKRRRAWVVIDGGKQEPLDIFNPFFWMFWWLR
jgi:hypothetical protein